MPSLDRITAPVILLLVAAAPLAAKDRVIAAVDLNRTVVIKGQVHPLAQPQADAGPVDPAMEIGYVTLLLKPDASLESFLMDLETPSSRIIMVGSRPNSLRIASGRVPPISPN